MSNSVFTGSIAFILKESFGLDLRKARLWCPIYQTKKISLFIFLNAHQIIYELDGLADDSFFLQKQPLDLILILE